jgi:hypothetical protein
MQKPMVAATHRPCTRRSQAANGRPRWKEVRWRQNRLPKEGGQGQANRGGAWKARLSAACCGEEGPHLGGDLGNFVRVIRGGSLSNPGRR